MSSRDVMCPAYAAINLLQEKWVLHIIRTLLAGPRGFNDLSRAIGGCNAATLADRLDRLEEMGLVKKTVQSVMPPRTTYALTSMGIELDGVVAAIDRWARKYLPVPPAGPDERSPRQREILRSRAYRRAGNMRLSGSSRS